MVRRSAGAALLALLVCVFPAEAAHQWVVTFGYANSGTPSYGDGVPGNIFAAGGGYSFGTRVDLEREYLWFGPAFLFWNNLTGDPHPDYNSSYFQAEFGARASLRTRTVPALYGGLGVGYVFSHGEFVPKFYGSKQTYDGEFPAGSIHVGAKTPSRTHGIGLLGEASYHFGLDDPRGRNTVGPARAFLVQVGFVFDILLSAGS